MAEVRDVKDTQSALTRDLESMYQAPISTEMGRWAKFKESFRRQEQDIDDMAGLDDIERANRGVANGSPLVRDLKNRHLQMISIGGSVGTGLLIGSGSSLRTGGPAALIIAWGLVGTMVFSTIHALGELCVEFPV